MVYHSLTHSTVALALFYLQFAFTLFILSLSLSLVLDSYVEPDQKANAQLA